MNCVNHRPPRAPVPPPPMQTPLHEPQALAFFTCTHPPAYRETEQNQWHSEDEEVEQLLKYHTTSQESCRYFEDCVFFVSPELLGLTPAHSTLDPSPTPTEPHLVIVVIPLCERDRPH